MRMKMASLFKRKGRKEEVDLHVGVSFFLKKSTEITKTEVMIGKLETSFSFLNLT